MRLVQESMEPDHEAWKFGSLEPWRVLQVQEQEEDVCLMDQVYSKYGRYSRRYDQGY